MGSIFKVLLAALCVFVAFDLLEGCGSKNESTSIDSSEKTVNALSVDFDDFDGKYSSRASKNQVEKVMNQFFSTSLWDMTDFTIDDDLDEDCMSIILMDKASLHETSRGEYELYLKPTDVNHCYLQPDHYTTNYLYSLYSRFLLVDEDYYRITGMSRAEILNNNSAFLAWIGFSKHRLVTSEAVIDGEEYLLTREQKDFVDGMTDRRKCRYQAVKKNESGIELVDMPLDPEEGKYVSALISGIMVGSPCSFRRKVITKYQGGSRVIPDNISEISFAFDGIYTMSRDYITVRKPVIKMDNWVIKLFPRPEQEVINDAFLVYGYEASDNSTGESFKKNIFGNN